MLHVFTKLECIQATQLKCFNYEKVIVARDKQGGQREMIMTIIFLKPSQALNDDRISLNKRHTEEMTENETYEK